MLLLLAFGIRSEAQSQFLTGYVFDSLSGVPVSSSNILNLNTGKSNLSRKSGIFSIMVAKDDLLAFSANGFYSDTIRIADSILELREIRHFFRPLPATLPNVTISGNFTPYQADSIKRRADFMKSIGSTDIPVAGRPNSGAFGVALNLDHFSKSQKKRRSALSLFDVMEEDAYINSRWNESLVQKTYRA